MATVIGTNQNDVLQGTTGADILKGRMGNDTYIVNHTRDQVVELIDRVESPGSTRIISLSSDGSQPSGYSYIPVFSRDGTKVLFSSMAALTGVNYVSSGNIFLKDLSTGQVTMVNRDSNDKAVLLDDHAMSLGMSLSPDATKVVFSADGKSLVANDTNDTSDIFLKDLVSGKLTRISVGSNGQQADGANYSPVFSPDGKKVAFISNATNLVQGDISHRTDILVKDLVTGQLTQVSTGSNGEQTNGDSFSPVFSPDGSKMLFSSTSSNLVAGDTNATQDIFIKDLVTGKVSRISLGNQGEQANGQSGVASFSADGSKIVFASDASNLVAGDTNNKTDIFVKDLITGAIQRVNTDSNGNQAVGETRQLDTLDSFASFSPEGRWVMFSSEATNLVPGDTNKQRDIFIKDLDTGLTTRITATVNGVEANGFSSYASFSPDGNSVVFHSYASNLTPFDYNAAFDILLQDLRTGMASHDAGGIDTVESSVSYTLPAGIERLFLTGTLDTNATGNLLDNTIKGNTGDNIINGGAGADVMMGGAGNDSYYVDSIADKVVELDGQGTDKVTSNVSYSLVGQYIEYLVLSNDTDYKNINATGNSLDNILIGNDGNNVLNGNTGSDMLKGGLGDDTYYVENTGDRVVELSGQGTDKVYSTVSFSLKGQFIENIELTGTYKSSATGNALNNTIIGNSNSNVLRGGDGQDVINGAQGADILYGDAGNDTLDGGQGVDRMLGGAGNDIYYVDDSNDKVIELDGDGMDVVLSTVSYAFGGQYIESIQLLGVADINASGNKLNNTLTGNEGSNILNGGAGDDVLDGGRGADSMLGGTGNDTFYVENSGDRVTELAGQGYDVIFSSVSYSLTGQSIEQLVLTGTASLNATGDGLDNNLRGNSGNNVLNGAGGADTMQGGSGDDTYYVDDSRDKVLELNGEGIDLVYSSASYSIEGQSIEKLTLTGYADIHATGNSLNNILTGNSASNVLDGGAGDDIMQGGQGNDTYYVNSSADQVIELASEGTDTVYSSVSYSLAGQSIENISLTGVLNINATGNTQNNNMLGNSASNLLTGGSGNDVLNGADGDDTLQGNTGQDTLEGGRGNDILLGGSDADVVIYHVLDAADAVGGNGFDRWIDFEPNYAGSKVTADRINIHDLLIDYHGDSSTSALAPYLQVFKVGTDTAIYLDRDGNGSLFNDTLLLTLSNLNTNLTALLENQQIVV